MAIIKAGHTYVPSTGTAVPTIQSFDGELWKHTAGFEADIVINNLANVASPPPTATRAFSAPVITVTSRDEIIIEISRALFESHAFSEGSIVTLYNSLHTELDRYDYEVVSVAYPADTTVNGTITCRLTNPHAADVIQTADIAVGNVGNVFALTAPQYAFQIALPADFFIADRTISQTQMIDLSFGTVPIVTNSVIQTANATGLEQIFHFGGAGSFLEFRFNSQTNASNFHNTVTGTYVPFALRLEYSAADVTVTSMDAREPIRLGFKSRIGGSAIVLTPITLPPGVNIECGANVDTLYINES